MSHLRSLRSRREKDAIQIMRRLLESGSNHRNGFTPISPVPTSTLLVGDDLSTLPPLDPGLENPSLFKKIEEVVRTYPNEKWTMRRMLAYLRRLNFPMRMKPEGSISAALGKLAKMGKLKVLRQGAGSVASIYQWNPDWREPESEIPDEEEEQLPSVAEEYR